MHSNEDLSNVFNDLSRVSDPLVMSQKHLGDAELIMNDKDRLNPYARETRETRATMLRKTEGRYL